MVLSKKIIVNVSYYQTRIAVLEDDKVVELYIESKWHKQIVGNIYKGIVTRVLPGMQAAFVNIGLDKDAFLYIMDFVDYVGSVDKLIEKDTEQDLHFEGISERRNILIEDLLKEGQELLVQVSREPIGTKGARVTTHITLPGRYLVYLPTVNHIGISKKIGDEKERNKLKELISRLSKSYQGGFIVRTIARNTNEFDFRSDMEMLTNLWKRIVEKSRKAPAPSLIHHELDPIFRVVRDLFSAEVESLIIDSEIEFERCVEFVNSLNPKLVGRIKLYSKNIPIFEYYGIEKELDLALRRKVWLKSGGYIVIDQTEALVTIDVNTGRYVGKKDFEETITKINKEAAVEIARQMRLRDLSGLIIIDFIDMHEKKNKEAVIKILQEEVKKDHSKVHIAGFTKFGLVELTRKRFRGSLKTLLAQTCPYCSGKGFVKSIETICNKILLDIQKIAIARNIKEIIIRAHPDVARELQHQKQKGLLNKMEMLYYKNITVQSDETMHIEQYDIMTF